MSSETLSVLLRPKVSRPGCTACAARRSLSSHARPAAGCVCLFQCSPPVHHAAVTNLLFLDDVDILRDPAVASSSSPQPAHQSSFTLRSPSHTSRAQSPTNDITSSLPTHKPPMSHYLSSLSAAGVETVRASSALVTASRDATIRVWNMSEERMDCSAVLEGHTEWVQDMLMLKDNRTRQHHCRRNSSSQQRLCCPAPYRC
jgi:WD40 repeat protein